MYGRTHRPEFQSVRSSLSDDRKIEWWGAGMVICLGYGPADATAITSSLASIQNGLTFLVPAYPGCPGKEAVEWISVCLSDCLVSRVQWRFQVHDQSSPCATRPHTMVLISAVLRHLLMLWDLRPWLQYCTSGYATWFTAGAAIHIGHYDVITQKL